jgi:hypothetical protein
LQGQPVRRNWPPFRRQIREGLFINPLNAELNPTCHLLALLGAHHILRVSGIRVNNFFFLISWFLIVSCRISIHQTTVLISVTYEPPYVKNVLKRHSISVLSACKFPLYYCLQSACNTRTTDMYDPRCGRPWNIPAEIYETT